MRAVGCAVDACRWLRTVECAWLMRTVGCARLVHAVENARSLCTAPGDVPSAAGETAANLRLRGVRKLPVGRRRLDHAQQKPPPAMLTGVFVHFPIGPVGVEPTTYRLRAGCSAIELRTCNKLDYTTCLDDYQPATWTLRIFSPRASPGARYGAEGAADPAQRDKKADSKNPQPRAAVDMNSAYERQANGQAIPVRKTLGRARIPADRCLAREAI